tara:strand:- start:275 stop:508 length:234 start_codon:yes stop_codon:yes gene_type:complete
MKYIILIFCFIFLLNINSKADEINDCSRYKKLSKKYISCKASNLKKGTVNTASKIKKKTGNIVINTTGKIKGILKKD